MQVKVPKQGALQGLCSEWEHRRARVQSGSTTVPMFRVGSTAKPVFKVGSPQSLCSELCWLSFRVFHSFVSSPDRPGQVKNRMSLRYSEGHTP